MPRLRLAAAALLLSSPLSSAPSRPVKPLFSIAETGAFPVHYEKFGRFEGRGTTSYKYKVTDRPGLARAMGSGLYPNGASLPNDAGYKAWKKLRPEPINHWERVSTNDPKSDFYVWATARDVGPGTKLFFTAQALVEAGHIRQALKAYHAVVVHFPKEACWSADHTFVWYVADAALGRIDSLVDQHPEIGWKLEGAHVKIINGGDTDLTNDAANVDPGRWVRYTPPARVNLETFKVVEQRGAGRVNLVKFQNGHWQLRVDGKPAVVRGVTYMPTPVGQHVRDFGNRWMTEDSDDNGKPDGPYDAWIDRNGDGEQQESEPSIGDFEIMKRMGVNAIRLYRTARSLDYDPTEFSKETLRDMHARYGIGALMGDFLGAYAIGSGASWEAGTDYTDPVQLENMRRLVRDYVMDHRKEPYVLMWVLGNENLMPAQHTGLNATRTNASTNPEAYLRFVNEIAQMIHQIDPDHPVAVANIDLASLDEHAKFAPDVDIFGLNSYRGGHGFGGIWKKVQQAYDRPVLITEFGCDAFNARTQKEDEGMQADYHFAAWGDIERHLAGGSSTGNAIGGVIFEYVDEWWKSLRGDWDVHDTLNDVAMASKDGWGQEEWYGLVSQGDGRESPFLRKTRRVYDLYAEKLWRSR